MKGVLRRIGLLAALTLNKETHGGTSQVAVFTASCTPGVLVLYFME